VLVKGPGAGTHSRPVTPARIPRVAKPCFSSHVVHHWLALSGPWSCRWGLLMTWATGGGGTRWWGASDRGSHQKSPVAWWPRPLCWPHLPPPSPLPPPPANCFLTSFQPYTPLGMRCPEGSAVAQV
jgi:hypothetical protein